MPRSGGRAISPTTMARPKRSRRAIADGERPRQHPEDHPAAVQRRDWQQVEYREHHVQQERVPQVLEHPGAGSAGNHDGRIHQESGQIGHREVDRGTRGRDPDHVAARPAQAGEIHRDRLRVTEEERRPHQQQDRRQDDGAKGVDVPHRIEGQPSRAPRRVVPELPGHPPVGGFVQRDRGDRRQHPDRGGVHQRGKVVQHVQLSEFPS